MLAAIGITLLLIGQAPSSSDFDEGKRLYFDLEYELAVFRFRDAARQEELPAAERARAYAWLGLAYAQIAEMDSAKEAFVDAARLDPEVSLPKEASPPPKALALMEEARALAKATPEPAPAPPPPTTTTTTGVEPASEGTTTTAAPAGDGGGVLGIALMATGAVGAGLGVLALGAGGGLGFMAKAQESEANASEFQDDAARIGEQAQQSALGANVLYVVGGVLVVAGAGVLAASFFVE